MSTRDEVEPGISAGDLEREAARESRCCGAAMVRAEDGEGWMCAVWPLHGGIDQPAPQLGAGDHHGAGAGVLLVAGEGRITTNERNQMKTAEIEKAEGGKAMGTPPPGTEIVKEGVIKKGDWYFSSILGYWEPVPEDGWGRRIIGSGVARKVEAEIEKAESGGLKSGKAESGKAGNAQWNTGEPPKDGKTIVLCGGLIWTGGATTTITPVCAPAYWDAAAREWCDRFSGMTLRSRTADELAIHWWLPYPEAKR